MASGTGVYEVLLGRKQPNLGAEKIKNACHLLEGELGGQTFTRFRGRRKSDGSGEGAGALGDREQRGGEREADSDKC
jgi:hypothetical protein